jgi:hypothetical protein
MRAIDIGLIQARRTRLATDIASHRQEIAALEAKLSELEIAEKVFAELALESADDTPHPPAPTLPPTLDEFMEGANLREKEYRAKPPGIPTVPEMIFEALRHAHGLGAQGLEPAGIASYIRGRYWPSAPPERITPIVWRMWKKDKKLEKDGTLYALPKNERPVTIGDKLRATGIILAEAKVIGEETSVFDDSGRSTRSQVASLLEGTSPIALAQ